MQGEALFDSRGIIYLFLPTIRIKRFIT